jgi:hypothetical protein
MGCGSTGLVPGVDCLPPSVPERAKCYGDVEYMLTWIKNGPNPGGLAIVTPSGAPFFGPATTVPLGGDKVNYDAQSGIRGTVGTWLGCDGKFGVEASGFILEQDTLNTIISSNGAAGSPVIARPFLNANAVPPVSTALTIAGPGLPGSIADRQTTFMWGAEANGVLNWHEDCNRRTDLLAGFTYTDLRETLGVTSISTPVTAAAAPGGSITLDDAVNTRNQFYAGQVGARTTYTYGKLSLTLTGKVAMGVNHETVDRFGTTSIVVPGVAPVSAPGGFLAAASNSGRVARDQFAIGLPSTMMLGYQVTDNLNAFVGWDFIYITSVVRPGDQVDLAFQSTGNGTLVRPSNGTNRSDFWANSLLAGLAFKF